MLLEKLRKKLKIKPILLLAGSFVLVIVLYFYLDTQAPKASVPAMAKRSGSLIDLDALSKSARTQIDARWVPSLDRLDAELKAGKRDEVSIYKELAAVWDSAGASILAAEYYNRIAQKTQTESDYRQAADRLIDVMHRAADSVMAKALFEDAYASARQAYELDSTSLDNQTNLGACIMEQGSEVMTGVKLLLGVVKKDPNHLKANFILAKFAVLSGQVDKAKARLEHLLTLDKHNINVYLLLAETYNRMGDRSKAVATLRTCVLEIKDEKGKKEIQQYIELLEKGN